MTKVTLLGHSSFPPRPPMPLRHERQEAQRRKPRNRHGDPGVQGREMEGAGGGGCDECIIHNS